VICPLIWKFLEDYHFYLARKFLQRFPPDFDAQDKPVAKQETSGRLGSEASDDGVIISVKEKKQKTDA
jgi:hypothetical protein